MKLEDFERVKVIGRGAFGEVQLVRTSHHLAVSLNSHARNSAIVLLLVYRFPCHIYGVCMRS